MEKNRQKDSDTLSCTIGERNLQILTTLYSSVLGQDPGTEKTAR